MSETLREFVDFPLPEAIQLQIENLQIELEAPFIIEDMKFLLPKETVKKLTRLKIISPAKLAQFANIHRQVLHASDLESRLSLSDLEIQIITFYMNVVRTPVVLSKLNATYNHFLIQSNLQACFKLPKEQRVIVYFAWLNDDPQPNDQLFFCLPDTALEVVQELTYKIEGEVTYECCCCVQDHCIECYGVMPKIIERIKCLQS